MNKLFLLCALLPFAAFAQVKPANTTQGVTKGFTLTGKITGLKKGTIVKLINANTSAELASTTVKEKKRLIKRKGKTITLLESGFELKGSVPEPDLSLLSVGDLKPYNLFVENSKITVTGSATDMNKWVVTGSASQKDFRDFESIFTPLAQTLNASANAVNTLPPGVEREAKMKQHSALQTGIQLQIDSFIARKPKSYVSPFVLLVMMNFNPDPNIAEGRLNKLDSAVRGSYLGKILTSQIAESKIGAVGSQAIEFTQADTSGNPIALSSFRGKYVLVDFWASWCGPCRDENPNVVANYQKFSNKNFTVLGVSLDRPGQKEKWLEAIKVDNLTWTHVSDLQWWNNQAAKLYHIQGIPQNILVDPNGMIVGKNLRGEALEMKLCELLGCN